MCLTASDSHDCRAILYPQGTDIIPCSPNSWSYVTIFFRAYEVLSHPHVRSLFSYQQSKYIFEKPCLRTILKNCLKMYIHQNQLTCPKKYFPRRNCSKEYLSARSASCLLCGRPGVLRPQAPHHLLHYKKSLCTTVSQRERLKNESSSGKLCLNDSINRNLNEPINKKNKSVIK